MGRMTKIDWCDSTWSPVTGCLHGCTYCYARRIATRFGGNDKHSTFRYGQKDWHRADSNRTLFYGEATKDKPMLFVIDKPLYLPSKLDKRKTEKHGRQIFENKKAPYPFDFNPTLHRYKLDEPQHWKKPRTVFVCSMADLFGDWVPDEWIQDVFAACEKAPQHRYLFLTKNPKRYIELAEKDMLPQRHWYGYSATTESQIWRFHHADDCPIAHLFVSIEPILEPMHPGFCSHIPADWVIIGAETGNHKGKVVPEKQWIDDILMECEYSEIPVFMKESLRTLMGDDFRQEFPWESDKDA